MAFLNKNRVHLWKLWYYCTFSLLLLLRFSVKFLNANQTILEYLTLSAVSLVWFLCLHLVLDNGIGIAPENLTKIFGHGFTTRHDGHGFGLHGSALAAHDLGGSLTVASRGLHAGASFTLKLPTSTATEPALQTSTLPFATYGLS